MNRIKRLATAIYPLFFALVGCHMSTKPVLKVPPSSQASYVEGGGTVQWAATGEPFEIVWVGLNPCSTSDVLSSDGNSVVTCHVIHGGIHGGTYIYHVARRTNENKLVAQHGSNTEGGYVLRTLPCMGCSIIVPPFGSKELSAISQGTGSGNEVNISCPTSGGQTIVSPPAGPTGLKVGEEVVFDYIGENPASGDAFTITFSDSNFCKNYTQTNGSSGYCQIAKAETVTYTAKSFQCLQNSATLTATTP